MTDIIIIAVLVCITAGIIFYLRREKKKGVTCVGCPYARQCAKKHGACSCGHAEKKKD